MSLLAYKSARFQFGRVADGGLVLGGLGLLVGVEPCATEADQALPKSLLLGLWSGKVRDRHFRSSHSTDVGHPLPSLLGQRIRR